MPGIPTKRHLESGMKKFNPHFICGFFFFQAQGVDTVVNNSAQLAVAPSAGRVRAGVL